MWYGFEWTVRIFFEKGVDFSCGGEYIDKCAVESESDSKRSEPRQRNSLRDRNQTLVNSINKLKSVST